ncbi:aminotransferase [Bordetella genomosp. 9]|uniref:Aminotransferase n=1 Tax=Bordetella genomosp. 9 TaxID=1416803 RepID=A0A261RPK4_9BORD|nr:aminotransferase class IV [Bordetella genomosp. 9]OZI26602.1 aminotransferase [Bordetella genomosp. 9]
MSATSSPRAPAVLPDLIETLRVDADGRMPLLDRHMARLQASCAALGHRSDAARVRAEVLTAAGTAQGPGPHRLRLLHHPDGTLTLRTAPLPPLPTPQGVCLWTSRLSSGESMLRHKTTHRPWYDDITEWLARHPDLFDAVLCNERGELCEGSRTNVYLQMGGTWFTPPVDCGCLPGVQRAALLDAGLVQERILYEDDMRRASRIRLSNALRGWMDVEFRLGAKAAPAR